MPEETTLLLLAGYCGVGKSTLMRHALAQRVPLFGPAHAESFLAVRPPPRLPEWSVPAAELAACGSWFNDVHLRQFKPGQAPRTLVLHVDLVSFFTIPYHDASAVADILPRTLANLQQPEANRRFARMQFAQHVLASASRVAVTTLYAPWEANRRRWLGRHKREGREPDPGRAWLFDPRVGPAIHRELHERWFEALQWLAPDNVAYGVARGATWDFGAQRPDLG